MKLPEKNKQKKHRSRNQNNYSTCVFKSNYNIKL